MWVEMLLKIEQELPHRVIYKRISIKYRKTQIPLVFIYRLKTHPIDKTLINNEDDTKYKL